jgi:hypothetical protein
MFSFSLIRSKRLRGAFMRNTLALFVVLFLFTALLFTGCQTEPEEPGYELDSRLIGTWMDTGEWAGDSYTITDTRLSYGYGADIISYAGTIKYVSNFTSTAGVIIIEYDSDHKPVYYDSFENYGDPDHVVPLKGNFIGVYYKNLNPGVSVQMGGAYADGGAEEATLDGAIAAFTMGNEGTYISFGYGTYQKQ